MKPPICKVCQKAHWTYEDHYTGNSAITPDYIKEMAAGAMGGEVIVTTTQSYEPPIIVTCDETPVTKRTAVTKAPPESVKEVRPLITRRALGRPKKHKDAAARQRAYRSRK